MPDVRPIDANALLDFISDERKEAADNKNHEKMRGNDYEMHFWSGALLQARWIRQYVNEAPTIDAVPVVHGRWILESKGNFSPGGFEIEEKCSECGRYVYRYEGQPQDNYCPNCGAKMDGGVSDG